MRALTIVFCLVCPVLLVLGATDEEVAIRGEGHIKNWMILAEAARNKNFETKVGDSYLLLEKSGSRPRHHALVVGTLRSPGPMFRHSFFNTTKTEIFPVCDFAEPERKKIWGMDVPRKSDFGGNPCVDQPTRNYVLSYDKEYVFIDKALPQFATADSFIDAGEHIKKNMETYNILTRNSRTFAKTLAKVASGKKELQFDEEDDPEGNENSSEKCGGC